MEKNKFLLIIDVSPLWEIQYTGISNVVFELTKRFLINELNKFIIVFSVFNRYIDSKIIQTCINERSGKNLQEWFSKNPDSPLISDEKIIKENSKNTIGLFLHRKQNEKIFYKEAYLFYDFSFLLTPECHTKETIQFHSSGLTQQINSSDLFFTISEATAIDLNWIFNIPKDKIVVSLLGNNVDTSAADKISAHIKDKKIEPYFLILGTIEPRKNINIVLSWISKNRNILNSYRFIFAGKEGWGKSFNDHIIEYELTSEYNSGRISHHGYVDEVQKAALLICAKALFYPSLFEGFGLPVLEAMQLGVPVIASCSTSIPEVLGNTGYYFDPYSLLSFENALMQFIKDDLTGRIEIIKINSKKRALEFSYDKTYLTIHQALVKNFI